MPPPAPISQCGDLATLLHTSLNILQTTLTTNQAFFFRASPGHVIYNRSTKLACVLLILLHQQRFVLQPSRCMYCSGISGSL